MVRFSNSKLNQTQYIINNIVPILGSSTSVITPISVAAPRATSNVDVSRITRTKTNCGVMSTIDSLVSYPDTSVELGIIYSNGFRYQYLDFLATTPACSKLIPDTIVTVQEQTDAGPVYVGSPVVPPLPKEDVGGCVPPPALKVQPQNTTC